LAVWIAVAAVLLVGLVPFKVASASGRGEATSCRGVVLEAWPERSSGWFAYAVSSEVLTSSQYKALVCGTEARRRMLAPALASALGLFAATVVLVSSRSRSRISE
jgi:hypothetical protein